MVSDVSDEYSIRLRDFRYPGELVSLLLTFVILIAVYFGAILVFPRSASQVTNALLVTFGGLIVYIITVVVQQRSVFGTLVRVSPRQFPEIWEISSLAEERLNSPPIPVCVKRSSEQNIYTLGFSGQPVIVITSQMIDQMPSESLQFFIGRELGHIRAGHTWLRTLLHPLGTGIPVIGRLLDSVVFGDWMNRAEFTADRAGFIACNSLTTAVSTMIKFSVGIKLFEKLDIREFLEQINDVRSVGGRVTEIVADQPYLVQRIRLLVRFALSKEFNQISTRDHVNTGILASLPEAYLKTRHREMPEVQSPISGVLDVLPTTDELPEPESFPEPMVEQLPLSRDNSYDPNLILVTTSGGQAYKMRRLITRIGRNLDNDVVISDDDRISRYHAQIMLRGDRFVVVDSGSRNGVWLNGRKIQGESEINPNDRLRMGRQEYVFSIRR